MSVHSMAFLSLTAMLAAGCSQPALPTTPTARNVSSTASALITSGGSSEATTNRALVTTPFQGNLEGTYSGSGVPPIITVHVLATGTASHLGRFTLDSTHDVDFRDFSGVGGAVLQAANGDTLTTTLLGRAEPQGTSGIFRIIETYTITGGTGRFAGASGEFVVDRLSLPGAAGPDSGTTSGSFEGTLSLPHGNR